jgi:hypothetical protein
MMWSGRRFPTFRPSTFESMPFAAKMNPERATYIDCVSLTAVPFGRRAGAHRSG